jgi:glycosyltransferase involved in cell wall biosynthesis
MKIVYLCGLFPKERECEIVDNSLNIIHSGPNKLQWTFLNGLHHHVKNLDILTTPLLTNFPRNYKKLFFRGSKFFVADGIYSYCLGSIRLPLIGLISKFFNILIFLCRRYYRQKDLVIFIYSVHLPYLLSASFFKLLNPKVEICLFVNDLPQYMSHRTDKIYVWLKQIELLLFNYLQRFVNSYVFVTQQLNQLINNENKPWVLIEGVYDEPVLQPKKKIHSQKTLLYSGTLDSRYGLLDLLHAFNLLDSLDYQLLICGEGNLKSKIIEFTKINNRIRYLGQLDTTQVKDLQAQADILINPRKPAGDYTKYSFPIKTLEYLASGKPCISYKLPGIPSEYDKYLIFPDDFSTEALANKIIEVANWDEHLLSEYSRKSQNFILTKKTSQFQFIKFYEMINKRHYGG